MENTKKMTAFITVSLIVAVSIASAADMTDITLPKPRMDGGMPLMQALKKRCSTRTFSTKQLPAQVMSDLLWAAFGISRPDSGKRTAPSARNWQEVDIYAVMEKAAYLYDPDSNILRPVAKGDFRKLTGRQDFPASAPLNLVYVADASKMKGSSQEDRTLYMGADVGFISQNVYLFCASEGLATVVRASVDRDVLSKALNLPEQKKIILCQTVGYPETDDQ